VISVARSARLKKEYLQWKRRQKAERAEEEGEEGEEAGEAGEEGVEPASGGEDGGEGSTSSAAGDKASSDDGSDGAERKPASASQRARTADAAAAREHAADARNTPPSMADMEAPLRYRPLEPVEAPSPGDGSSGGRADPAARMVRLTVAEVGQTDEGRGLGMPTRPAWQVGRRAQEPGTAAARLECVWCCSRACMCTPHRARCRLSACPGLLHLT
jgi:hypothetical protein